MWRYLRKRRALKAYRSKLFRHLRDTYGRKLYYSTEEVRTGIRTIGASVDFECYALGMFTERAMFDAYHAATGEACDYQAMRAEVFAHVADVPVTAESAHLFDGGCEPSHHDSGGGDHGSVDGGWFDSCGFDGGSSHSSD
jgi:hypothetical protein